MTYVLNVMGGKQKFSKDFNSVTAAYTYYLDNFATADDDDYYYDVAKTHLVDVKDEDIMAAIFRNVFLNVHLNEI